LGDKFCLTEDHDVYTDRGWVGITDVTVDSRVAQLNHKTGGIDYVNPLEVMTFTNSSPLVEIETADGGSQCVTQDHRLYVRFGGETQWRLLPASIVVEQLSSRRVYCRTVTGDTRIMNHRYHLSYGNGLVYCLRVPSEVFLVRRSDSNSNSDNSSGQWTGNSNRHGQKGTAGAFLRGHDMPRTASGIIPDMIMNTHAIPSRMTIAQNLEQLAGKAMAALGSVADCTAFMNDGSPEAAIGSLLEHEGFEKYGNEILYNGATGEQIPAAIFMGPVYGMRLKHMVEDKWQARAQGRKEQISHQPTGGRGNQGGLKIGEMDRDAIICHGLAGFMTESFMKRSDGTTIPLCTSCGTVPIYNPKLAISLCPMCDGPAEYAGETAQNLELLPPLKRQTGSIVNVAMPFATNVVTNELIGLMNIGMRYVTTGDVQTLRPAADTDAPVTQLRPRTYKEVIVPTARPLADPDTVVTLDAMARVSEDLANQVRADEALNRVVASLVDEEVIPEATPQVLIAVPAPVFDARTLAAYAPLTGSEPQEEMLRRRGFVPGRVEEEPSLPPVLTFGPNDGPPPLQAVAPPVFPAQFVSRVNPQGVFDTAAERDMYNAIVHPIQGGPLTGGGPQGGPLSGGPLWGGGPPLLSVDTSPMAMAPFQGGGMPMPPRRLRMAYQQGGFAQQQVQQQQQQEAGQQQSPQQSPQQSYSAPILVRKLE
jgi:hypothetical protein